MFCCRLTSFGHMVVGFIPSCSSLSQQPCLSNYVTKQISSTKYKTNTRTFCITRPPIPHSSPQEAVGLRVFVLSDLHTDYAENLKWVKSLSTVRYKNDVLVVAGDVAETYKNFIMTMSILKDRFEHVFFVPGNHDLWCRREGDDNVRDNFIFYTSEMIHFGLTNELPCLLEKYMACTMCMLLSV